MSVERQLRRPRTPSTRLNTGRNRFEVSSSTASSTTPSPTPSNNGSHPSTDPTLSFTDPDDYTGASAPPTVSSATMTSKSRAPKSSSPVDAGNRRASSRVRKPTAKAQALDGTKLYSPPLSDTIVVSSPPPPTTRPHRKEPSTTPGPTTKTSKEASVEPQIPESPTTSQLNTTTPPPKTESGKDEAEISATESPSRRVSQRERKPTAKALLTPSTAQKRPAPPVDVQEAPPRKSARISFNAAKVPSKLRYSLSSTQDEPDQQEPDPSEPVEIPETPQSKKSKIVVLKTTPTKADDGRDEAMLESTQGNSRRIVLKSKRLSEITDPGQRQQKVDGRPKASKRQSRRHLKPEQAVPDKAVARPEEAKAEASCDLSCLPPWSRLLAFAEMVNQMPDTDDEDEEVVPGSAQDWHSHTKHWCQCNNIPQLPMHETDPNELARALVPNTVSQGTQMDPVDLTEPAAAETELLSQPVNTILRATDAERLSQLFATPNTVDSTQSRYATPASGILRNSNRVETPTASQRREEIKDDAYIYVPGRAPSSDPGKRTYEDRLREDYQALAHIRKRATRYGIQWSFNMTVDDISALLSEYEERQEQEWMDRHPGGTPGPGAPRYTWSRSKSPAGFGVLFPARGATPGGQQQQQQTLHQEENGAFHQSYVHQPQPEHPHDERLSRPQQQHQRRSRRQSRQQQQEQAQYQSQSQPQNVYYEQIGSPPQSFLHRQQNEVHDPQQQQQQQSTPLSQSLPLPLPWSRSMSRPRYQPAQQPPTESLSQTQQSRNARKRPKDTWFNYSSTNGTPELLSESMASPTGAGTGTGTGASNGIGTGTATTTVTFVEDLDARPSSHTRRPSSSTSPTRARPTRFRVDPRGLLGESPGPGTIINIEDRKHGGRPRKNRT